MRHPTTEELKRELTSLGFVLVVVLVVLIFVVAAGERVIP